MKKNKKKLIITIIICAITAPLLIGCIALYMFAASVYEDSFRFRCTTSEEDSFSIDDFPLLTRERHVFESNKRQKLVGYLYEREQIENKKGVIVFAHGLGAGGQRGYMKLFNYMASHGYYVFAYDATGNDESEGEVIGGLPQGTIDLDYAICYAQTIDEIKDLPFVLVGYSWGAMSVGNVLNYHPEVKAAVAISGWNKSMDMIRLRGYGMVGNAVNIFLPFASLYEFVKYGKYAFSSAMKGFAKTDCAVMIVHGQEDGVVPIEYGYGAYYEKYGDSDRFVFKKYANRGHNVMSDASGKTDMSLMTEVVDFIDEHISVTS